MAAVSAAVKAKRAKILATNDSIRTAKGYRINWDKPLKPGTMAQWHHQGRVYKGSFRTICHLVRLNNLAKARFGTEITVIQPDWNTTVAASAGTHDFDSTWDLYIPGVDWWVQQAFFRRNGFACWYRHPPLFGYHIHGFSLPNRWGADVTQDFKRSGIKVGLYIDGGVSSRGALVASAQISDYYAKAYGLANAHARGSDSSWYPKDIEATIFQLKPFIAARQKDAQRAAKVAA